MIVEYFSINYILTDINNTRLQISLKKTTRLQIKISLYYHYRNCLIDSTSFLLPLFYHWFRKWRVVVLKLCCPITAWQVILLFFLTITTTVFNIVSHFLKLYDVAGPLLKNPSLSFESDVNKYCVKFRTYIVEYDVEEVKMILSDMFHFFV